GSPMSPLASTIYKQLRKRVIAGKPSITYGELAQTCAVHVRSRDLYAALGEITNACRHAKLPALTAMVWRSGTRKPADRYFEVAHPRAHTPKSRVAAWEREHASAIGNAESYPPSL